MALSNQDKLTFLAGLQSHVTKQTVLYDRVLTRSSNTWIAKRKGDVAGPVKSKDGWGGWARCICYLEDNGAGAVEKLRYFDDSYSTTGKLRSCKAGVFNSIDDCCKENAQKGCPTAGKDQILKEVAEEAETARTEVEALKQSWCACAKICKTRGFNKHSKGK
eukprot:TRINITY_DN2671_c0_g1_i1.p1 TRINITY_DN2671_c0_g1~~TRINITY_DN2671_c0_g1_i1.p1  ORF type:complete len:185 (+),score=13.35 TRINITY_DN2671_c0_g1_i1:70-555(+)